MSDEENMNGYRPGFEIPLDPEPDHNEGATRQVPWWRMDRAPASRPEENAVWILIWVPYHGVFFGHVREQEGCRTVWVNGISETEANPMLWTYIPHPHDGWLMDPPDRHIDGSTGRAT